MGLFYFFNLTLEIQALHLMEEDGLGEGRAPNPLFGIKVCAETGHS